MKAASETEAGSQNRFERRRQRTHREILDAAVGVMAEKGVHGTKIADIAAAADVGVGTFYLHFSTKQELFDGLVTDAVQRLKEEIDAARATCASVLEQVTVGTAVLCRFASENRAIFRVVFGHSGTYHEVVREAQSRFATDIEATIREGIDVGVFGTVDPTIAAEAIIGMSTQLLSWWTARDDVPIEALEETLSALTLRGLGAATVQT